MPAWLIIVEWLARILLVFMVGLSIWSISIILERRRFFRELLAGDAREGMSDWLRASSKETILAWAEQADGIRAGTVKAALSRRSPEQMERAVHSYLADQRTRLERGLPVLGTLGSTTPFVGLLGTILGIIVAFGALSSGQLDSQKIMYALAEALVATAIGLAVAIPAVVAYNLFSRRVLTLQRECDSIKDLLLAHFAEGR